MRGLEKGQKAALVINEMQRGVVETGSFAGLIEQVESKRVVANIAALADAFRAAGLPIVHTHVVHRPDYADVLPNTLIMAMSLKTRAMAAGSPEAASVAALAPQAGDFVMSRTSGLGVFYGTELDGTLRRLRVETIVATGVSANIALSGLSLGGTDRGYQVILPQDCIAAASAKAETQMIENQLRLLATIASSGDVATALSSRRG